MAEPRWVAGVLARTPRVAVFDCDGTLWGGDAGAGFMQWSLDHGLVAGAPADRLRGRYALYLQGKVDEATICGEMVQVYAGLREDAVRTAARDFFKQEMEHRIFPEMHALVESLSAAGAQLWAVSSTCDWAVEAGLRGRFPIPPERTLAAHVRVERGIITDRLLAVPTDDTKASALVEAGIPRPDAVFGNSVHDLPMLRMARNAYPVHPTPALLQAAERENWPVFLPAEAAPAPAVES